MHVFCVYTSFVHLAPGLQGVGAWKEGEEKNHGEMKLTVELSYWVYVYKHMLKIAKKIHNFHKKLFLISMRVFLGLLIIVL